MPFDDHLAHRLREVLAGEIAGSEGVIIKDKRMFGGLAIMINGHMCCGVVGQKLVLRVGETGYKRALSQPHARPMDFTGRAMRGFVYVDPAGFRSDPQFRVWIRRSLHFVLSLPPK
jgi:TfoX/Sxy family transcriptional regulator of competence genes